MAGSTASKATIKDAAAQLASVRSPVLVVMGGKDSDFPDPEAEAAAILRQLHYVITTAKRGTPSSPPTAFEQWR